jgi:hypothetical protein
MTVNHREPTARWQILAAVRFASMPPNLCRSVARVPELDKLLRQEVSKAVWNPVRKVLMKVPVAAPKPSEELLAEPTLRQLGPCGDPQGRAQTSRSFRP